MNGKKDEFMDRRMRALEVIEDLGSWSKRTVWYMLWSFESFRRPNRANFLCV